MISASSLVMALGAAILFGLGDGMARQAAFRAGSRHWPVAGRRRFAFVLLQLIGGLKLVDAETQKFLILLVAISIAATPILVMLYGKFCPARSS